MNKRTSNPVYLILLMAFSQLAVGQVFTWVDADGVTHYSETPPEDPTSAAAQLELPPVPAAAQETDADYYSVINQAARMEARRLEFEKLRAERLQAEAATRRARAEELAALELAARQATGMEEPRYYPLYLQNPRYGHRPPHGHRPPPGHRPPRPDHHYRDSGSRNYIQSRRNDPVW